MIVSGLLTSIGINLALCITFITLYSVLRKQPYYFNVYSPRLVAGGRSRISNRFNLEMLLPHPDWLKSAWSPSEEELLSISGLDAVVFMRIIIFSLKMFTIAGIIGIFILLPVNCSGNQLQDIDFANLTNNSLDVFSISNVNNGSKRLWIHLGAVYFLTIAVCYLLHYEYENISSKRVAYFFSSKPEPHQFTILVSNIPVSYGSSVSNSVESFFTENHPSTYLSHVVVHRTNKIRNLIIDAKNLYNRLKRLRTEASQSKFKRGGYCGLYGRRDDLIDHYEKKLEDIEDNVRMEQSDVSSAKRKEVRAAFVSFRTRYGAAIALHMRQSSNPTRWLTEQAPEPQDIYWPFFSYTFMRRWIAKLVVIASFILLMILFLIPVFAVQGLANLAQLEAYFPFLTSILTMKIVSQLITGYLPNLILLLFLKLIPPVMKFLTSFQGYVAISQIERSACNKVVWFTIWNVFFANVLSGSLLKVLFVFLEPKEIPAKLAVAVPAQDLGYPRSWFRVSLFAFSPASFFIAYVLTSGWTSIATELFRVIPLIGSLICKPCARKSDDDLEVPSFPYHENIPRLLFFGLLGVTYFFLAPLIIPFLLVYFSLTYIIYRNQIINVYAPKYESGGAFWPIVHDSVIFSLVLMHAIAVGIFTLKKLSLASSLTFPLPILTLLFNEYCRKRFLPTFISYSAETLIKKDREDQHDASMAQFLEKLGSAYQDPALVPFQSSVDPTSLTAPLIPNVEA